MRETVAIVKLYYARCAKCGARTADHYILMYAANLWNDRAKPKANHDPIH